ncbi:MAG TPA: tetratricopeptide repeat protein [Phycisphaerae bacterium]|nr:tetratricopeptide repeat protein [Phycisphaerae bacterium]
MAKTLNRKLVGGLTFAGMIILAAAGFLLLANLPTRDPKVYEEEAKKHEEKGEWNQAWQAYVRACQRDTDHNPEYQIKAAKAARAEGTNVNLVRDLIQQARVTNTQLKSAAELSTDFEYELAKLFPSGIQWNRVMGEAKKLLSLEKDSALGYKALGNSYFALMREDPNNREKGEDALKRALELDPGDADTVDVLARDKLASSSDKERAGGSKQEVDALRKTADSLIASALAKCPASKPKDYCKLKRLEFFSQIIQGETQSAMKKLEELAESNKEDVETLLMLGSIYSGNLTANIATDLDKAEKYFKRAIEADPKDGRGYQMLGQHYKYKREGEKDKAKKEEILKDEVALYKKGLETIPLTKHYKEIKSKVARVGFFSELALVDLDAANATEDEAKKKKSVESAESWINQLKQEIDPTSLEARYLTASLLRARGETVPATKEAEAASRINGANDHVRLQALLAELYFKQNQWGACAKALKRALELVPGAPVLKVRLGQVYLQMNEPTLALAELKPLEAGPVRDYLLNDPNAIQLRIEAYRQLNQPELAKEEGQRLASKGIGSDDLRDARILFFEQKYAEAEAKLKAILAKTPDNETAVLVLYRVYEATDRLPECKSLIDQALAKNPDNRTYRRIKLAVLDAAKNDEAVLSFLKEDKDPFERAMNLADYYARRENMPESVKYLDEAEKLKPRDPEMIDRQLRTAANMKDWTRMAKFVARDGEVNSDGTEGKIAQGRMAYAQGKYPEAIELLNAGLSRYPSSLGWTYLGEVYLAIGTGHTADAKAAISKALDLDPTNAFANRGMAQIIVGEGDEKAAQKYVTAALRGLPTDKWLTRQKLISKEKENPTSGIAAREKNRKDNPSDIENLILLARLYSDPKVAKYDKAAEIFREAFTVSKGDLRIARELARFYGRDDVNKPGEGEAFFNELMNKESDKSRKAQIAACMGLFYEVQKALATADRNYRLAVSLDPTNDVLNAAGEFYARNNRFRDSVAYYERLKKQATKPEDATLQRETHNRIIALWLAIGDLDQAKKEIDEFVAKYPTDPQGLIYTGSYHRIGGDIAKAKEAFDAQLEKQPNNAVALWQRGQMFMLMGKWQNAIDDLRKAKTFDPDGFGYQHRIAMADCLIETGHADEAIVELKGILDQKPDQVQVATALVDAYARSKPPKVADAENVIFNYMRLYPKDYKWPWLLGQLGERMNKWDKAVQGYEKAAELARENLDVIAALFHAYRMADKSKAMTDYLAEKISERQLDHMPLQLAGLGWAYVKTNRKEKALDCYDRALTAAGEDYLIYQRVIEEMVSVIGEQEATKRAVERAATDPQNIEKQKAVVHLLQRAGRNDEAMAAAKKVQELAVRDQDVVFAHLAQALLALRGNKFADARAQYEAVLKVDPKQSMALNDLAYLLADNFNAPAEALPYAQQAARSSSNDADVLDTLGYVLMKNNRPGEAIGALLRAKEIDHYNIAVNYHLGQVYEQKNEADEAKIWYRRAKDAVAKKENKQLLPNILEALKRLGEGPDGPQVSR